MGMPDTDLIRDADLRERLEAARGKPMFEVMARHLVHTQQERDKVEVTANARKAELAAMPREKRRRAIVREVFENSPPTPADIRHIHSVLAICGLPYDRQPMEVREYSRIQGNMGIIVQAGVNHDPHGNLVHQPLPFGPKARLILMHLCSEAIRQKSPTIEIAETFTAFVREMGFTDSGGKKGPLTAFREQLNALATCSMRISAFTGERMKSKQFFPIEDMDVWLTSDPRQKSLWPSTVTFSPTMFESLSRHALPVNAKAVRTFAGSARKLDLYFWLGYRLHNIERPLHISWKALGEQFGNGFTRERDFKAQLAAELADIAEVFPKLPAKLTESGLTLTPAGPEILALPALRPRTKR